MGSDNCRGWVRYPYQKQWMCSPKTDWTHVSCFYYILYIWCCFDVFFVLNIFYCIPSSNLILIHGSHRIFCRFTLGTILYKKVVPAMWSPFRDHTAGDHIKQAIIRENKLSKLDPSHFFITRSFYICPIECSPICSKTAHSYIWPQFW